MACGLPIVMSEHSSDYTEIIDDTVVFVKNDPKEFKEAFEKIISNKELRTTLIEKSLSTIKKVSGDIMEENEFQLYQKLISSE